MTKTQYLNELRKELKANSVGDIEDIMPNMKNTLILRRKKG